MCLCFRLFACFSYSHVTFFRRLGSLCLCLACLIRVLVFDQIVGVWSDCLCLIRVFLFDLFGPSVCVWWEGLHLPSSSFPRRLLWVSECRAPSWGTPGPRPSLFVVFPSMITLSHRVGPSGPKILRLAFSRLKYSFSKVRFLNHPHLLIVTNLKKLEPPHRFNHSS